jgi:hypothetical protein
MLSRRDFLQGASALAMTPQVERVLEHHLRHEAPLLTCRRQRPNASSTCIATPTTRASGS